jgi:hypothetical protein
MTSIAIIDYGMGNLRSVAKALEHVAPQRTNASHPEPPRYLHADRVVFPGQGRSVTVCGNWPLGFGGRGAGSGAQQAVSGPVSGTAGAAGV